jgi:hypothetical protein
MTGESGQMANERGKNEPQVDPKLLELLACPLLPSEARALGADEG